MAVKGKKELSGKRVGKKPSAPLKRKVSTAPTSKKARNTSDSESSNMDVFSKPEISSSNKNRKLLFLALILAIAGGLYLARGLFVAAMVNGSPVTRLEIVRELEKTGGKQTLDNLVTKKLILQELSKRNITISDEDVNKEIDSIKTSLESQNLTLDQVLAEQGQTMEMLKENVKIQKGIEIMFEGETSVTDEDVASYYEQNKSVYGEATLEEVKEDIKNQLKSQDLSTKYREWLVKVKADSKVLYFVNY